MAEQVSEEDIKLLQAFKQLGPTPDPDSKEALQRWLLEHAQSLGAASSRAAGPLPSSPQYVMMPPVPKLPMFSGTTKDCAFDLWAYEVECLRGRQKDEIQILNAINRSLKNEPARIVMMLGPKATLEEILAKLHSVYGDVHGTDTVMTAFFNASQKSDETVSEWSVRVEELASKAVAAGQLGTLKLDSTLRNRFWHGLRPSLRDKTGHKFDSADTFDKLRTELRKVELTEQPHKSATAKAAKDIDFDTKIKDQVAAQVKGMEERITKSVTQSIQAMLATTFQQNQQPTTNIHHPPDNPYQSGGRGQGQGRGRGRGQGRGQGRGRDRGQGHQRQLKCYECGEIGHVRPECPLNFPGSAGRGDV